jgi:hypothetical protein
MNDVTKQWKPGGSGNQPGRPRAKFVDAFVGDVAQAWEKHGSSILEMMITTEPTKFAELARSYAGNWVTRSIRRRGEPTF